MPWEHPEQLDDYDDVVGKTLYGQQWLTIVFDEAQGSRNYGAKHSAALLILERCKIRLILTATPLQTRPEVCRFDFYCFARKGADAWLQGFIGYRPPRWDPVFLDDETLRATNILSVGL